MMESIELAFQFIKENVVFVTAMSFGTIIVFALLGIITFIKLPHDYFIKSYKEITNPLKRILLNILAIIFVLIGILLLFLPGQGVLTIILGISISQTKFKKKALDYLFRKKGMQNSINNLRIKLNREPFDFKKSS